MYALLIAIHAVFIGIAHIFSYRIFEGVFLLLGCFFLFYFSPLFFLDKEEKKEGASFSLTDIFSSVSLKNSFLIPMGLFYVGLSLLLYSLFGTKEGLLFIHAVIVILLYAVFLGYGLLFYWKHDVFFEALRFHTLFTLLGTILLIFSNILSGISYEMLHLLLLILGIGASIFLLTFTRKEGYTFLITLLFSLFLTCILSFLLVFPRPEIITLFALSLAISCIFFDLLPRLPLLEKYTAIIRYFALTICLVSTIWLISFVFIEFSTLGVLALSLSFFFLLSIHIRFTNYIGYIFALFLLFFLYSVLFIGLLDPSTPISLFLFIFFLPVLLLWSTYIIEEAHTYDFIILHYSSIGFSVAYSLYSLFFLGWWGDIFFILSFTFFGIALLLFLSYFRFRKIH